MESVLVAAVALSQAPAPPPPIKAVPFFVLIATFGSIVLPLLWWRHALGYAGAIGVGVFALTVLALVASGAVDELDPNSNPAGSGGARSACDLPHRPYGARLACSNEGPHGRKLRGS